MKRLFVLSLGGSLIVPEEIDTHFLKKFRQLIIEQTKKGKRFIIITGGGRTCRKYNKALSAISKIDKTALDWMGVSSTWLNAKLVQLMFGRLAYGEIAKDPKKEIKFNQPILVGGGWKPGRSSDGAAVEFAKTYKTSTLINLSNVDYVYDKNPRKFRNARKMEKLTWNELLEITGRKWVPGKNVPFDPTAAKFAKKHKLKVIIANGKNLKNLKNIFNNKKFQGTTVI